MISIVGKCFNTHYYKVFSVRIIEPSLMTDLLLIAPSHGLSAYHVSNTVLDLHMVYVFTMFQTLY